MTLAAAGWLLVATALPAGAMSENFDAATVGAATAGQSFAGVSVSGGLVVDDALLTLVLGPGPYATSGTQGLYNADTPAIVFDFDSPISAFRIDVISLVNGSGALVPVLAQAYDGTTPLETAFAVSSASGGVETLALSGGPISRVVLFPHVDCSFVDCGVFQPISTVFVDVAGSFFADTLEYSVPEPAGLALWAAGLAFLGLRRRRARTLATAAVLCTSLALLGCGEQPTVVLPEQGQRLFLDPTDLAAVLPVEIDLVTELDPGGSVSVILVAGIDSGTPEIRDISGDITVNADQATGGILVSSLPEGRSTLMVGIDRNGDGNADHNLSATFDADFQGGHSIARIWNETLLDAIRRDTPRPTVHARNLLHLSIAMWDCWVAYDQETSAQSYLSSESHVAAIPADARHACISHAAYRLLTHRFAGSIGAAATLPAIDAQMTDLGYDTAFVPAGGGDNSPEAVGYRIAGEVIAFGLADGANEAADYVDPAYTPYNFPLIFKLPGTGDSIINPNRWTPLAFDFACLQNSIPIPAGSQVFIGSNWNVVTPFALTRDDPNTPYFDPGLPPQLVDFDYNTMTITGPGEQEAKRQFLEVVKYSAALNPDDAPMINISPGVVGGDSLAGIANYEFDGQGHPINPYTGLPYPSNWVNEADFGRVVAEFWADGPDSETPPGHWNTLANYVTDHPAVERRIGGVGPVIDLLEWEVKLYLALNGAVHDAAVAAWGAKGIYDYARPVAGIRWFAEQGQSSDPGGPSYSPHGLPLEPGLSEIITAESSAVGERHEHLAEYIGQLALNVWPGEPNREQPPACGEEPAEPDPDAEIPDYSGREWILGSNWITYQRRTFVTPPFAAYTSGHSTFSMAAAAVMSEYTGDEYFPGGYGEFVAPANNFLQFEVGPSNTVKLQWGTYYDAAVEAGISRLWGGIHIMADNIEGLVAGHGIGHSAYDLAEDYWNGTVAE